MTADGRDPETGKLLPGHSVVPRDRWHPGKPTQAELIRKKLEPHREAVLDKAIDLARQGDPKSMTLVLQYLAPPARPEGERFNIPRLAQATTLQERADAIIEAVASAAISAETGAVALGLLEKYSKLIVVDEHERRIAALEGRGPGSVVEVIDACDTSEDIA
ncbi:hypothetical protein [Rubrivivax albus]|uniref:Uncharacterized protein n=1 Tax=Rubrivivax albus TaxID=2499835 RepID=A0A437K110_9BURK|nr:hypothetical protein [Rubrivivax albus]RVT53970.1 hypothetical protein ENE75_03580 [Rubrivivax albus]